MRDFTAVRSALMTTHQAGIYQDGPYRSGALTYQELADKGLLKQGYEGRQAQASDVLREAGIPGIRYLDQGSRGFKVQGFYEGKPANDIRTFSTEVEANKWADYLKSQGLEARPSNSSTSNYVVFDPSIIDILKKYGVGSIAALPPAVQAALSQVKDE